ncbi:MAG TPA: glycogen debranching protein GlgX [Candidatus Limnocylindria bacterium]|nr:glycogen debranching protein GlgX [Candidatus Limnocylindria bacterium]
MWAGQPYPLGATYDGLGVNFSLFSEVAERVELCLFDAAGQETRVDLPETTGFVWHGYVPQLSPGQRYGYRVHGPWAPAQGKRCNPAKLLLDPYAKAIEGNIDWDPAVFPYRMGDADTAEDSDSAPFVPRSVVITPFFDWSDDRPPRHAPNETIIYETHVKGLTMCHPGVPAESRGTYAGMAHPVVVEYLQALGITTVELLPVHQFVHHEHLVEKGLRNYWGYDSIGYFAPHNEYASSGQAGEQVAEFKGMVMALHQAGLEVILDVVYNHTAEGNQLGPMLSFRGIDNEAYYRLVPDDKRFYTDYTGTGNTLNVRHPHTLQLIMDSLRYWIMEMHVDGFRFDLAAALARGFHEVDRLSAFFDLIQQDPVVSQVKLIAEPWDVGEGGYQVGNFPPLWSEWNGRYRDTVRDFWRRQPETLADLGYRLTGSSDLYESTGRRPYASVNFVTAHDGFTLADLVSYNDKHNEANGEDNRDGTTDNRSWNCGIEGPTDDPDVLALRRRQQRNFLATLLLSQGMPLLLGGDELGRSQGGNNNAYCQDNEISWYAWTAADEQLLEYSSRLIGLRREHPVLRRRRWFQGRSIHGEGTGDLLWFTPEAVEMGEQEWERGLVDGVGIWISGAELRGSDYVPRPDRTFYLIFSARAEASTFRLPAKELGEEWELIFDTAREPSFPVKSPRHASRAQLKVESNSVVLLCRVEEVESGAATLLRRLEGAATS